jgi:regulator of RNase E activity RraA
MRFVGRAFTVQIEPVDDVPEVPYVGLLRALDALGADDVYVIPTGGDLRAATWGELLSTTARARGAVAAVTDGAVRDAAQTIAMGFPTFARTTTPNDIHGRYEVRDYGVRIEIDGVSIRPGDLVAGDIDGVVVVPSQVKVEVLKAALQKARAETFVRDALEAGTLPSKAFAEYGVL